MRGNGISNDMGAIAPSCPRSSPIPRGLWRGLSATVKLGLMESGQPKRLSHNNLLRDSQDSNAPFFWDGPLARLLTIERSPLQNLPLLANSG